MPIKRSSASINGGSASEKGGGPARVLDFADAAWYSIIHTAIIVQKRAVSLAEPILVGGRQIQRADCEIKSQDWYKQYGNSGRIVFDFAEHAVD